MCKGEKAEQEVSKKLFLKRLGHICDFLLQKIVLFLLKNRYLKGLKEEEERLKIGGIRVVAVVLCLQRDGGDIFAGKM